jgi:hypothetical protein
MREPADDFTPIEHVFVGQVRDLVTALRVYSAKCRLWNALIDEARERQIGEALLNLPVATTPILPSLDPLPQP